MRVMQVLQMGHLFIFGWFRFHFAVALVHLVVPIVFLVYQVAHVEEFGACHCTLYTLSLRSFHNLLLNASPQGI